MHLICSKQKLQESISIVTKAIGSKSNIQLLEGVYLEATSNSIKLIGSNIDVSIQTIIEAKVINEGRIVIDSKIFSEIIRKLPNSEVNIELLDNEIIQITCEKSTFNIVCMNATDYPKLPQINESVKIKVPQNILKNMIKGTSFAIAQDESRPILQGVLFELKNKSLNLVALDGYRLAIRNEILDGDDEVEVVIPGKTLNELSKILEDNNDIVEITFTNNQILFNLNNTKIISRLLEGKFMDYKSLLPKEYKLLLEVNKQDFQNGIERASLMSKDGNSNLVKLEANKNNILIISSNSQLGKVREEVSINLQGEEIEIAFNSKYLLDIIKNMEDENIIIEMTNGISPCIVKGINNQTAKYLVLPVRLIR